MIFREKKISSQIQVPTQPAELSSSFLKQKGTLILSRKMADPTNLKWNGIKIKYGGYPTGLSMTQQTHEDLYMQQGTTSQSLKHMRHNL